MPRVVGEHAERAAHVEGHEQAAQRVAALDAEAAEVARGDEDDGDLCELRGLQADRTQPQPTLGSVHWPKEEHRRQQHDRLPGKEDEVRKRPARHFVKGQARHRPMQRAEKGIRQKTQGF